jgi:hypothetical protein
MIKRRFLALAVMFAGASLYTIVKLGSSNKSINNIDRFDVANRDKLFEIDLSSIQVDYIGFEIDGQGKISYEIHAENR